MTQRDPFADLSLASGFDEIVARMSAVRAKADADDPEALAVVSLQFLAFLDRIVDEGEATAPDDPTLGVVKNQRAMLRRMFGDHIAAAQTGRAH